MTAWLKGNEKPSMQASHAKLCVAYLPLSRDDALVVPYAVDDDIGYYELGEHYRRCAANDAFQLGELVRNQFRSSERRNIQPPTAKVPDYRLKFSKLKSNRQFDTEYASYKVRGANSANIIIVFESPTIQLGPLYIAASCNAFDEVAIGATLMELHDFYRRSIHRQTTVIA